MEKLVKLLALFAFIERMSCILILALLLVMTAFSPLGKQKYKIKTIVIDAGHGGHDPGKVGKKFKEKDIALAISLDLGRILKKNLPDVNIVYTRLNDKFVELHRRTEIGNKAKGDLFISIHCNSVSPEIANQITGTETYVMGTHVSKENLEVAKRENSVIKMEQKYTMHYQGFDLDSPESLILLSLNQQVHIENSMKLATKIEKQLKQTAGRKSRGVKQAGFVVLAKTNMPSVLVETGFLSNPNEEIFLASAQGQMLIASAIYRAIKEYKQEVEKR
ncbi:MAG: N-acetylmuramoyl-L-alanine amidase [Microscillaceae bacterium]|nr:N-acetylmuramoyl-L-alanine amidase [Microscillaceae bacterium]MDW8460774.1 N-acetylmuramoyl-L-alanine amidase [Cytophagales bacterium]